MKNDLEQILNELQTKQPSEQLDQRMSQLFQQHAAQNNSEQTTEHESSDAIPFTQPSDHSKPSTSKFLIFTRFCSAAAAVVLIVFLYQNIFTQDNVTNTNPHTVVPHGIDELEDPDADTKIVETWSDITPGDVVEISDNRYVRPIQFRTLKRVQNINSEKNVNTESYEPRNEILLVPVRFD